MHDSQIVELYLARNEDAINETEAKYSAYLSKIAYNILGDFEDAKESVNDTYLKAWNSIPPTVPQSLSMYLAKITRRASIDIYRKKHTRKRFDCEYGRVLEEIELDFADDNSVEESVELKFLGEKISEYLRTVSSDARNIFLCRYYFCDSIKKIAQMSGYSEAKVKSSLHRTRVGLKDFLRREGVII